MPGIIYRCPVDHSLFTTKTDDSAPVDSVGHVDCLKCKERALETPEAMATPHAEKTPVAENPIEDEVKKNDELEN